MTNLTANASTKGHQITIPSDFPIPQFSIGQMVETIDKSYEDIKGRIVGMTYTSRDAALAEHSYPGWRYIIETPAFERCTPHHESNEDNLQTLAADWEGN